MPPNPVYLGHPAIQVKEERKGNAKLLLKDPDRLSAFLEIDPEDHKPYVLESLMELLLGGSLPPAIGSGGRKKPQQDDLAAEV